MKHFFLIFLGAIVSLSLQAQDHDESFSCGTPAVFSEWLSSYLDNPQRVHARSFDETLFMPLTVHAVGTSQGEGHYSATKIFESICQLNEDFAPYNIQFYLKNDINYINRDIYYNLSDFDDGRNMMQSNRKSLTINCFIVNDITINDNGICGFFHPSGDAIALRKSCMGKNGHTWTHEIGHWLSLPHTFFGWEGKDYDNSEIAPSFLNISGRDTLYVERVNGSKCDKAGDRFCDTPPDYLSASWNCNGEFKSNLLQMDPEGASFRSDGTNYMSYSVDGCQSKFSGDQAEAMRSYIFDRKSFYLDQKTVIQNAFDDDPVLKYPVDNEATHYQLVNLEWDHIPNATHYLIQISRFSFFPTVDYEFMVEGNSFTVSELPVDRKFFWRIKPYNAFDFCRDFSSVESFETYDVTAVEEISKTNFVEIFPTLVSTHQQKINIRFDFHDILATHIDIYNLAGQSIFREKVLNPGKTVKQIPLDSAIPGMYFLRLTTEEGSLVKKFSIQ